VRVGVRLHGFLGMMLGMQRVAMRGVGVLGGFVMIAGAAVLGRDAMVLRGMLVMLGGFFVVVGGHCRVYHVALLWADPLSAPLI